MKRPEIRSWFIPFVFCSVLTGTAAAQPQVNDGELIVSSLSSNTGVYAINPDTGQRRTLETYGSYTGLLNAPGNYYGYGLASGRIIRISTFSSTSTLATLPSTSVYGAAADQDGSVVIAGYSINRVLRVTGSTVRTLSTVTRPRGLCRDRETGDFVVGSYSSTFGTLLRMNRATGRVSTFAAGAYLSSCSSVVHLPTNGNFVVGRLTSAYGLVWVTNQGATVTSVNIPYVSALTFDEKRNRIFAGTTTGDLYEVSPTGSIVGKRSFSGFYWSGIDVWGSSNVTPSSSGKRGLEAYASLRFQHSTSRSFCAALALGQSPGIRAGGRWQHIRPDGLFFATVCGRLPVFTRNFSGTLTTNGTAGIYFTLPASSAAVGIPIYVTASAINPAMPGNLDLGNVACFKIEP